MRSTFLAILENIYDRNASLGGVCINIYKGSAKSWQRATLRLACSIRDDDAEQKRKRDSTSAADATDDALSQSDTSSK
jgi:hypothetical protein